MLSRETRSVPVRTRFEMCARNEQKLCTFVVKQLVRTLEETFCFVLLYLDTDFT